MLVEKEKESSNQPAVAASQLWRGTRLRSLFRRGLAAPKRKRRRVVISPGV
jgi:hypothetical protein